MDSSKRHAPTQHRLERAKTEGQVAKSPLITHFFVLIGCFVYLKAIVPFALVRSRILLECLYSEGLGNPEERFLLSVKVMAGGTVLLVGPLLCIGLLIELSQLGWRIEFNSVAPKLSRIDPLAGFSNLLSHLRGSWEFVLRAAVFSLCFWWVFRTISDLAPAWIFLEQRQLLRVFDQVFAQLVWRAALALCVCGTLEWALRRRSLKKKLMMSDQEIKQEQRESEGDPLVKAVRRAQHEAISLQELTKRVRESRVIVVDRS